MCVSNGRDGYRATEVKREPLRPDGTNKDREK